jgi:hypothetical protein
MLDGFFYTVCCSLQIGSADSIGAICWDGGGMATYAQSPALCAEAAAVLHPSLLAAAVFGGALLYDVRAWGTGAGTGTGTARRPAGAAVLPAVLPAGHGSAEAGYRAGTTFARAVALDASAFRLAVGSGNGQALVYDTRRTSAPLYRLRHSRRGGLYEEVRSVVLPPGSEAVVTASYDGLVRLWSLGPAATTEHLAALDEATKAAAAEAAAESDALTSASSGGFAAGFAGSLAGSESPSSRCVPRLAAPEPVSPPEVLVARHDTAVESMAVWWGEPTTTPLVMKRRRMEAQGYVPSLRNWRALMVAAADWVGDLSITTLGQPSAHEGTSFGTTEWVCTARAAANLLQSVSSMALNGLSGAEAEKTSSTNAAAAGSASSVRHPLQDIGSRLYPDTTSHMGVPAMPGVCGLFPFPSAATCSADDPLAVMFPSIAFLSPADPTAARGRYEDGSCGSLWLASWM